MRWAQQLEGDGKVLEAYGRELGLMKGWEFIDIPSLDVEVVKEMTGSLIEECLSIIVIAPTDVLNRAESNLERLNDETDSIFFIKQTIDNACGTIALLHTLTNIKVVQEVDSSIIISTIRTLPDPQARGTWLEGNESIYSMHESYAAQGSTSTIQPEPFEDNDLHFISIVLTDIGAVWLDGRKDFPLLIPRRTVNKNNFVKATLETLSSLVINDLDVSMAILALVKSQY